MRNRFAREQKFGPMRTASLFNICLNLLNACIGESACACAPHALRLSCLRVLPESRLVCSAAGASFQDAEATIKMELLAVCRAKPGSDTPFMSAEQIARIGQYLAKTFFTHYRLYQHCFSKDQDLTEYTQSLLVSYSPPILTWKRAVVLAIETRF
jgi:hypothetical protein